MESIPKPSSMARRVNILIVEHYGPVQEVLVAFLKNEGYNVDTATNGREATRKLTKAKYELVLASLIIPEIDGIRLLYLVKEKFGDSRFIMMGSNLDRAKIKASGREADGFIAKPFLKDEVTATVRGTLDRNIFQ